MTNIAIYIIKMNYGTIVVLITQYNKNSVQLYTVTKIAFSYDVRIN